VHGRIGPRGNKVVERGAPERSELLLRMARRGAGRMPPLATELLDDEALRVLNAWIAELPVQSR
jgi:hypothetical protein